MKVNGKIVDQPNEVLLVLPRETGDLVFKFRAVVSTEEFEKLCPEPTPPRVAKPGGEVEIRINDPGYRKQLDEWAGRQTHWQFLQSIKVTDRLEWETVRYDDPGTWQNWRSEMESCGFSIGEMNAIWAHFMRANSLSVTMIDEARKRFLALEAERAVIAASSSLQAELSTSLSGEPANDSESALWVKRFMGSIGCLDASKSNCL